MLPKKRRISRREFGDIITKGRRYNSTHLLLYVTKDQPSGASQDSKFSFSVSKKVSLLAVNRNKYRRQGYSVVSTNIDRIKPGYMCFFSFKKGQSSATFDTIEKEILELLSTSLVLK